MIFTEQIIFIQIARVNLILSFLFSNSNIFSESPEIIVSEIYSGEDFL